METRRQLVWGRSPAVSRQLALLAVALLGLLSAVFFTDVNTLWPAPLAASGVPLVVGLAAVGAYYNEGLVVAWLLSFSATLPAFVFYPPRGPTFAVTPATAPLAVGQAAAVALGSGTVGFAIGAALLRRRDRRAGARFEPSPGVLPDVLVGTDRRLAGRWLLVAVGEFVAVFAVAWFGLLPFGVGAVGLVGIAVLLGLAAAPPAYVATRNRGLLVCWVLAFAPPFGVFLPLQLRFVASMAPDRPVLYALGTAAMVAIPAGTLAFLLGLAARAVRRRLGPRDGGRHGAD